MNSKILISEARNNMSTIFFLNNEHRYINNRLLFRIVVSMVSTLHDYNKK